MCSNHLLTFVILLLSPTSQTSKEPIRRMYKWSTCFVRNKQHLSSTLSPGKNIVTGMASTLLRLLVILLSFSHLICSLHAVPITRTRSLMHKSLGHNIHVSEATHLATTEGSRKVDVIKGRMDVELNDYPGSGANGRHTPKPPQLAGRACGDC